MPNIRMDMNYKGGAGLGNSGALLMGAGNSTTKVSVTNADKNFLSFYLENKATSGTNRGMYLREYISGAGGGGEAARIFTTVNDVAADTVHGSHTSLNFASTGTVTGQGIASRNTLHLADQTLATNVTLSAVEAEIWCDGTASDPGDALFLSFFRVNLGGNAEGVAKVIDSTKAVLFDIQGIAASADGTNGLFRTNAPSTLAASLKVLVGSTLYYLPLYSGQS
jgi:hypothetical protein